MKKFLTVLTLVVLVFSFELTFGNKQKQVIVKSGYNSLKDTLCTPNPSREAVALYRYLLDMYGEKILTGQMWVPWGINEIDYIEGITGKKPAMAGFDYINSSSNVTENQRARDYWNNGGISTIMWHWGAPGVGEGYNASLGTASIDSCFTPGTDEYEDFWYELDRKADLLTVLRDSNIPVIWRPLHELNGGWFWWSKEGPEQFERIWITMFNYFVHDRGLNNLIWVLCYTGSPDGDWYPGDEYIDIAGGDTYDGNSGSHKSLYNSVAQIVDTNHFPICFHECGVPPDPDECLVDSSMWSWWMEWHTGHLSDLNQDYLIRLYDHDLNITLDEVPDIMGVYNWNDTCASTEIVPYLQIDGGSWQQTNNAGKFSSSIVTFSPETEVNGIWSWSGCGTSGSNREQTITVSDICTATATFLNECGATSTQTFNVYNDCTPTTIIPHLQVNGGEWKDTARVKVSPGSTVILSPETGEDGSWLWSGCEISDTTLREQTFNLSKTCSPVVTFTNYCGKTSKLTFRITVTSGGTEISSTNDESIVSLFPIPCIESLNIKFRELKTSQLYTFSLFSIDGSKINEFSIGSSYSTLDVSKLEAGIYFLKIENAEDVIIRKIIKQ